MIVSSLVDFFYRAPHTKTDCKDKLFFILKWNSISLQQKFCDDLFFSSQHLSDACFILCELKWERPSSFGKKGLQMKSSSHGRPRVSLDQER